MRDDCRRAIAYIAGRLIGSLQAGAIYDFTEGHYHSFSGHVGLDKVSVFDYTASCYTTGTGESGRFSLFHYGSSAHVDMRVEENKFQGYDSASASRFSGTVTGKAIALYDHGTACFHDYSL